jgi:hypothetical protein
MVKNPTVQHKVKVDQKEKFLISIHAPKALKPQTDNEFGYFLAGLIDADGHISKPGYVQIDFHVNDISVAYYIKKKIGYGKVTEEKKRFSVRYRCTPILGLVKIADLIRHKLKHLEKIDQFNTRLVPLLKKQESLKSVGINCDSTVYTSSNLLENHWLAGFIQGDGSLVIIQSKAPSYRYLKTTLVLNIYQKAPDLLKLIKEFFGGSVGHRKDQDTYYYNSNSFTNAAKLIRYLDKYQLMGNKLTQYWIWRKTYLIVQEKEHLTAEGEAKISLKKERLAQLRKSKLETLSDEEIQFRFQAKQKRKILQELKKSKDLN